MKMHNVAAALLLGAASFMMLSGFDSAATAEDVLNKYEEVSSSAQEFNADMTMAADISLAVEEYGMSLDITASGNLDMAYTMDPLAMGMQGQVAVGFMGQNVDTNLQFFMVPEEDGSMVTYVYTEEEDEEGQKVGSWQKSGVEGENYQKLVEMLKNTKVDFSELPVTFELAEAPVDVNGTECYQLTTALTWDDVVALIEYAVSKVDEETASQLPPTEELAQLSPYTEGLVLNLEMDVDTQTYQPARFYMDAAGSDWDTLSTVLAAAMGMTDEEGNPMAVNLTVSSLYAECLYDFSTPVSIVVPQEAIDTAVEVNAADALDALNGAIGSSEEDGE